MVVSVYHSIREPENHFLKNSFEVPFPERVVPVWKNFRALWESVYEPALRKL